MSRKVSGTVSHHEREVALLQADRERAGAYLKASRESLDDPEDRAAGLLALRTIAAVYGGWCAVAAEAGRHRESLYRAVSPKGNPTAKTILAVLTVVGMGLSVQPEHRAATWLMASRMPRSGGPGDSDIRPSSVPGHRHRFDILAAEAVDPLRELNTLGAGSVFRVRLFRVVQVTDRPGFTSLPARAGHGFSRREGGDCTCCCNGSRGPVSLPQNPGPCHQTEIFAL